MRKPHSHSTSQSAPCGATGRSRRPGCTANSAAAADSTESASSDSDLLFCEFTDLCDHGRRFGDVGAAWVVVARESIQCALRIVACGGDVACARQCLRMDTPQNRLNTHGTV